MAEIMTRNADETRALGFRLGQLLRPGDVLALEGPLGAGKTELVRGLCRGLQIPEEIEVQSPTFTIVNVYPGEVPLYHIDLYRVNDATELYNIGLEEYLYGDGVSAVEWFSLCPQARPKRYLSVEIAFIDAESRKISLEGVGDARLSEIAARLAAGG
jgi:tRNA threonylcarbamoyladenosine biosynthesis protein TsaE